MGDSYFKTEMITKSKPQRMAEMLQILKDLRVVIDQQHLLYLELDESPRKIDQRKRLENCIKDYLYVAPHDSKFMFRQTAEVLYQSASTKSNFSAYKAAVAWKAIGKYADNLILNPWRKEYRDIKLYCGFFKHEIEESLAGAELMFEAMGYRHSGQSSMSLHGIIDPDRITSVSKDAIVAYVECQIMKEIWEVLSTQLSITWLEILEYRERHTGTPEQVIHGLIHRKRFRHFFDELVHRMPQQVRMPECNLPHAECLYAQHSGGYYSHPAYPGPSCSIPIQSRCAPVISSQHMMSTAPIYPTTIQPSYAPPMLKPQDIYPVNGYSMHHQYPAAYSLPHIPHNGYSGMPTMCPGQSVPTGQLIELEPSPTHMKGNPYVQRYPRYSPQEDVMYHHQDALKDDGPSLTGKAKDDGAGSWENWDYVYRNLESHGYAKDSESYGRLPVTKDSRSTSTQNNSSDDIDGLIQTEFPEKMRKLKLSSNSQSKGETSSSKSYADIDEGAKVKSVKEKSKLELDKTREPLKTKTENKTPKSPEKVKKSNNVTASKSGVNKQKENEPLSRDNLKKSKESVKPLIVNLDNTEDKWQCVTCTYLNSNSHNVCEMCYKSKERGSELNPQPSGGQECPKCTLVNEPGLNNCAACNSSLKGSPTYI